MRGGHLKHTSSINCPLPAEHLCEDINNNSLSSREVNGQGKDLVEGVVGEVWGGTGGRCPGGKASYRDGPPRVPRQKCVTSVYIAFACVITRHELVAL